MSQIGGCKDKPPNLHLCQIIFPTIQYVHVHREFSIIFDTCTLCMQVNVTGQVIYEAICPPSAGARVIRGARSHCPVSDRQFQVAGAGHVDFSHVRDQVRTILEDTIVVGFDIANDLKVLGISLPPQKVRDIQKYFDAEGCSRPEVSDTGLPALDGQHPKHSLKNLVRYLVPDAVKGCRSFQEGPHSALEDARATMTLYLLHRAYIERRKMEELS